MKFNHASLKRLITQFPKVKVLVIGDLILDEFIWGTVSRISPEAPVPVVLVNTESFMPGGSSNVAHNISTLGAKVSVAGVIGDDERGRILHQMLTKRGVDTTGICVDTTRPTTLKTRIVAHSQQVVRIDREKIHACDERILDALIVAAKKKIASVDAVLIEDYGKGVIGSRLLKEVVGFAKAKNKIVTVDPKDDHFDYYKGVTGITPNHHEAGKAVKIQIKNDELLKKAGKTLLEWLDLKCALVTLGENGMCLFERNGAITKIPTMAQEVYDVSGAGDTVISVFTLALALGAGYKEAAYLANHAAAIVVGKVGIAVVKPDELKQRLM